MYLATAIAQAAGGDWILKQASPFVHSARSDASAPC
jgi:hypothetical protein